jgi:hypothetical protein
MTQYYTYLYRDIDGTPIYVGKGCDKRAWSHNKSRSRLGNTLRKRFRDGASLQPIIFNQADEQTALDMEVFWIAFYGREDLGKGTLFNLTAGGEGISGYKHTQSFIDSRKGLPSPNKGKPGHKCTENTKELLREARKLQIVLPETNAKISAKLKGVAKPPRSSEHSAARKGSVPWNKGLTGLKYNTKPNNVK